MRHAYREIDISVKILHSRYRYSGSDLPEKRHTKRAFAGSSFVLILKRDGAAFAYIAADISLGIKAAQILMHS